MNEQFINKYIKIIDNISLKYNYPNNIKHLLYIIIPALILKYGIKKEHIIIECLNNVPIIITGKEDNHIQGMYISYPYFDKTIKTKKSVLLNRYNNIDFMQLLDNLIHEINHAINSYKNEIIEEENIFYLRTGLSYVKYDKKTFKIISKSKSYILEEIINSKQTESIIDYTKQIKDINNIELQNTLYAIKNSFKENYISNSYYILKSSCKELLNNKTFLLTVEDLRINGNIKDIESWFNEIYGNKMGYISLINTLYGLKNIINKNVIFKKQKVNNLISKLMRISKTFNDNCNLK